MTDKGFGEIWVGKVDKKQCRKIFQKKFAKNLENKKTCLTFAPLSALKKRRGPDKVDSWKQKVGNGRSETGGWRQLMVEDGGAESLRKKFFEVFEQLSFCPLFLRAISKQYL